MKIFGPRFPYYSGGGNKRGNARSLLFQHFPVSYSNLCTSLYRRLESIGIKECTGTKSVETWNFSRNTLTTYIGKEVVVDFIDCNPWFTSQQHNNSMKRLAPKTDLPLDDSERKWKQKDWLVKQKWYIYVFEFQILANVQIYSHIITLAQNLNFQTDTNLSDIRFLSQISLVTKLINIA